MQSLTPPDPLRGSATPATAAATATAENVPLPATIEIDARRALGAVDRNVYGHFLEGNFFGNIQGGIFDEGSPLSLQDAGVTRGLRQDVIETLRSLGVPVCRWPGGNYASAYHWEDGIGRRDTRPRRLELTWGGREGMPREEDNRFGTDEFLAWCDLVGAEPYLNNSGRSVEEAIRWLEYTNYGGDTHYTRLRAATGHPEPYGVRYWGLGNEVYGAWQMGHRTAEQYAADAREHALFMRHVDPTIRLVAVGRGPRTADDQASEWTRALLRRAGSLVDYLSIHLYGASLHLATADEGDDEFETTVGQSLYFEAELRQYADLVSIEARRAGLDRPPALAMDEWNIRHLEPASWPVPQPGDDGGIAVRDTRTDGAPRAGEVGVGRRRVNRWSPRTLADALFYAGVFHAMQRLCGHTVPVAMANTVNLVNANGLLAVRPDGLVKSTTFHVWDLYQNHTGPIALPVTVDGPAMLRPIRQGATTDAEGQLLTRPGVVPYLDVAATLSQDRRTLHVTAINRHRTANIDAQFVVDGVHAETGGLPRHAAAVALGQDSQDLLAVNARHTPDRVALRDLGTVGVPAGRYTFPPHSITLLSFFLG
jgi:alpha-L-arabinofuranosidase